MRYYGHACVEINSCTTTVLMDPLVSYDIPSKSDNRLTFHDLPDRIDAVVISHLHLDHFCVETLLQLRHKVNQIIVPKTHGHTSIDPSAKWILRALGFQHIIELDACERHQVGDIVITALPFQGEHGCLDITSKAIFKMATPQLSYLFMADMRTPNQALLQALSHLITPLDVLFIGMECEGAPVSWVYGCLLDQKIERQHDQERRLNGSDARLASEVVKALKPTYVRVYALGREPWLSHIMKVDMDDHSLAQHEIKQFLKDCEEQRIHAKVLYINHCEQYEFSSGKNERKKRSLCVINEHF